MRLSSSIGRGSRPHPGPYRPVTYAGRSGWPPALLTRLATPCAPCRNWEMPLPVSARSGSEAMSRVAGATNDARATGADVKVLAGVLTAEAESLNGEVSRFLAEVQAA